MSATERVELEEPLKLWGLFLLHYLKIEFGPLVYFLCLYPLKVIGNIFQGGISWLNQASPSPSLLLF